MRKKFRLNPRTTMGKVQETTLEIDLNALAHNFHFLKSKFASTVKFMAVVKAFAYGSDAVVVAKKLEQLGADYFAVAFAREGVALRDAGIKTPILVLHPQPSDFEILLDKCLEPNLYSLSVLRTFIAVAKKEQQQNYPVHLEFNTGLNRLGLSCEATSEIADLLSKSTAVKVKSVFSHMAASEDENEKKFTQNQISKFKIAASALEKVLGHSLCRHMCNTSGIFNYPEAHFDMVRSGIGLYGFGNNLEFDNQLKPVSQLKSLISQLHTLQPGDSLGYNRAFIAQKKTKSATIPIGHADGIGRQYGNGKGYVFIHGQKAPIVGNVCMDMLMVDVTHIPCKEGDEVIFFDAHYSANTLAETAKTISYELITGVSQRVKRVIIN